MISSTVCTVLGLQWLRSMEYNRIRSMDYNRKRQGKQHGLQMYTDSYSLMDYNRIRSMHYNRKRQGKQRGLQPYMNCELV